MVNVSIIILIMRQEIVFCNVSIYPPRDVARSAIALSKSFLQKDTFFTLDSRHAPHITVYIAAFQKKNLPLVKKLLRKVVARFASPKFSATSCVRDWNDYVGVYFTKTKTLSDLQAQIVEALNPLREKVAYPYDIKFTSAEKKNIKEYGYDLVFGQFKPHLTITRLRPESRAITPRIPLKSFSFRARSIVLFEMGEHATGRRVVGKSTFRNTD